MRAELIAKKYNASIFLVFMFASFSFGEMYRHIIVLMALVGIFMLFRKRWLMFSGYRAHILLILFACLWIPMVISLFDSHYLYNSGRATLRYLIYLLSGLAIITLTDGKDMFKPVLYGCSAVMLFWAVDGLIQLVFGSNILGYPYSGTRLSGMFYPSLRVGVVLSMLSPIYFETIRYLSQKYKWAWLLLLPFFLVVIYSGSRSAWMLFTISVLLYLYYWYRIASNVNLMRIFKIGATLSIVTVVLFTQVDWLGQRLGDVSGLFSGKGEGALHATSLRTPLWKTAIKMSKDNWINGVGPRSYKLAYDNYSDPTDSYWYGKNSGHPHFFILEISSETGIVGIIGYVIFLVIIGNRLRNMISARNLVEAPWLMAVLIVAFPLGSTHGFYVHFSSGLMWYLIIISLSTRYLDKNKQEPSY